MAEILKAILALFLSMILSLFPGQSSSGDAHQKPGRDSIQSEENLKDPFKITVSEEIRENAVREYKNSSIDIAFTLPEGWTFDDLEEFSAQADIPEESGKEEKYTLRSLISSFLPKQESPEIVMFAYSEDRQQNCVVVVSPRKDSSSTAEQKLIDPSAITLSIKRLEEMGVDNVSYEITDISFRGNTVPCVAYSGTLNGLEFHQAQVAYSKGGKIINISSSVRNGNTAIAQLSCFSRFSDSASKSVGSSMTLREFLNLLFGDVRLL